MIVFEDSNFKIEGNSAVTLGNFDGVHLGHQKLISTVHSYAEKMNLKSVVFSFYPHPVAFFASKRNFKTMFNTAEKYFVLKNMDIDYLVQYPFTKEFSGQSPKEFMELLIKKTGCKVLVVGENYNFGKDRAGNLEILTELGNQYGVKVIGIPSVTYNDERVSSTRIRELISRGEVEQVIPMLKKPYFLINKVVSGNKRGRLINFPTINLEPPEEKMLPPDGAYVSVVVIDGKIYKGITNIGKNPTFNNENRTVETHIFDFNEEIYGKEVLVGFYKLIRAETKFDNIEELKNQLLRDKEYALSYNYDIFDFKNLNI